MLKTLCPPARRMQSVRFATTPAGSGRFACICLILGVSGAVASPAHPALDTAGAVDTPPASPPSEGRAGSDLSEGSTTQATDAEWDAPRPGRAALAMGAMLALGTAWYWAYRGDNAFDWEIGRASC